MSSSVKAQGVMCPLTSTMRYKVMT